MIAGGHPKRRHGCQAQMEERCFSRQYWAQEKRAKHLYTVTAQYPVIARYEKPRFHSQDRTNGQVLQRWLLASKHL